jgi:hypothetical protein
MTLQNLPKVEFLVRKQTVWQPCSDSQFEILRLQCFFFTNLINWVKCSSDSSQESRMETLEAAFEAFFKARIEAQEMKRKLWIQSYDRELQHQRCFTTPQ